MAYFWSDMTDEELAEWFTHFTPAEFVAALREQERLYGIPADYKVTDARTLAKVAKLVTAP